MHTAQSCRSESKTRFRRRRRQPLRRRNMRSSLRACESTRWSTARSSPSRHIRGSVGRVGAARRVTTGCGIPSSSSTGSCGSVSVVSCCGVGHSASGSCSSTAETGPTATTSSRPAASSHRWPPLGVHPDDVTDVLLTHLHYDHTGWLAIDGRPTFANANVLCAAADLAWFADPSTTGVSAQLLPARVGPLGDRLSTFSTDGTVLPGVDAVLAPGHTPGSTVFVISDGEQRVVLHRRRGPLPGRARRGGVGGVRRRRPGPRRREHAQRVSRELDGVDVGGAHFPGLDAGTADHDLRAPALDGAVIDSPRCSRRIADATRLLPERASLVLDDDVLTHGDVDRMSALVARGLAGVGLGRGSRVAVLGPNHLLSMVATLGIIRAGATWIPLNPRDSIDAIAGLSRRFRTDMLDLPLRLHRRARPDPERGDDDHRDRRPRRSNQAAPARPCSSGPPPTTREPRSPNRTRTI